MFMSFFDIKSVGSENLSKPYSENLSKPNLLGINFCVQNRQMFGLYMFN